MATKKKLFGHKDYRIKPTYIGLSLVRIIDYAAVVKAIKEYWQCLEKKTERE